MGVTTCHELVKVFLSLLTERFGIIGEYLKAKSNGKMERRIGSKGLHVSSWLTSVR